MRSPRFLHVGVTYNEIKMEYIHMVDAAVASEANDWIRYAWNCYLVWTTSDCETISRKINRIPGLENVVHFVVEINVVNSFGSFPPWLWEWLARDRGVGNYELTDKPLTFLDG